MADRPKKPKKPRKIRPKLQPVSHDEGSGNDDELGFGDIVTAPAKGAIGGESAAVAPPPPLELTPKPATPWWRLFDCCRPDLRQKLHELTERNRLLEAQNAALLARLAKEQK